MISPPRPSNCVAEHVGTKHAGAPPTEDEDEGMETKHTPGPWFLDNDEGNLHVYPSAWKGGDNRSACRALIAVVSPWDGRSQDERDARIAEAHANARLIASAPELYEVCAGMLRALDILATHGPNVAQAERERAREILGRCAARSSSREGGDRG